MKYVLIYYGEVAAFSKWEYGTADFNAYANYVSCFDEMYFIAECDLTEAHSVHPWYNEVREYFSGDRD